MPTILQRSIVTCCAAMPMLEFDMKMPSTFVPAAVTDTRTFGFKTFVRVTENNCQCNCLTSPTTIQCMNGETDLSEAHINMVVTQIR